MVAKRKYVLSKSRKDAITFKQLDKNLRKIGLRLLTQKVINQWITRFNLNEPEAERLKQTLGQTSYYICFPDGYSIVIHTSFNPKLGKYGEFTTKGGSGWIIISGGIVHRKLSIQIHRRRIFMENFVRKISNLAEFFTGLLENRPLSEEASVLMDLQRIDGELYWTCPIDTDVRKSILAGAIYTAVSREAINEFVRYQYGKKYYEQEWRPKKGITKRVKRKSWKK